MKLVKNLVLFSLHWCWSLIAHGHDGHVHGPVSIKSALEISVQAAKEYSVQASPFGFGLLPVSWGRLTKENATIHANKLGYYIVALDNPREGKVVYFKIQLDGIVAGANFTGVFTDSSTSSARPGS